MNEFLANINLIKIVVLITLVLATLFLKALNPVHRMVLLILWVNFLTEATTLFLKLAGLPFSKITILNIVIEHCLWLYLLGYLTGKIKTVKVLIGFFMGFAVVNFFWIQGREQFNYYTFVLGSFLYIVFFIRESFNQLERENFDFIFSNDYLLLSAPVIFLFGISFMFAFVSGEITRVTVFFDKNLFSIVNDYVNIIYYSLLTLYIYREKGKKIDY